MNRWTPILTIEPKFSMDFNCYRSGGLLISLRFQFSTRLTVSMHTMI